MKAKSTNSTRAMLAQANFPKIEEEILAHWQKTKAFEKSVEMRSKEKTYVFYDGPPFATGLPHYGHLLGSTSKDVIPRFWTMKGFRVERVWGWDCHGLPIETMIQKQKNISGQKQAIEEFGIANFNQACRSEVLRLDQEWEKIIARLGRWVDFANNYKTMDLSYMESVWWAFKSLYEKGLIYEGKKVIMYSPSSMTPLSNFEIAMDNSYKDISETATTYKYKIKQLQDTYLLAWSTTPWNKIATPALAINDKILYAKVKQNNEYYILAKSRLEKVLEGKFTIIETFLGEKLGQYTFELHYDFFAHERKNTEKVGVIVSDDFVTDDEGTGVVTLAVYGEEDYRVMKRENIQLVEHVDDTGSLKKEVTLWPGAYYLKANKLVDEDLLSRKLIYKQETITHSVPLDYRTAERVYYAPVPAWFINVQKIKQKLIDTNKKINWFPEHLKTGRFQKGIENAPDWNISRSRFWGTPIPVWKSTDPKHPDRYRVIGSLKELQKWAVDSKKAKALTDIHREFVDDLEIWIDDEKTIKGKRIEEVFDCWVESGSMPFASRHYPFKNQKTFEKEYPSQFISEYIAQTRAWFYTLHVISVGLFDTIAFENVLTTGTILASDGTKMSKSKNNYPDPMKLINSHGVDSLRLYLMSSTLMKSENLNFNEKEVIDIKRNVFNIWWNLLSFFKLYATDDQQQNLSNFKPDFTPTDIMDKWIMSKLNNLIKNTTSAMEGYNVISASRELMQFVQDLSTWYLRTSRNRLRQDKSFANSTQKDELSSNETTPSAQSLVQEKSLPSLQSPTQSSAQSPTQSSAQSMEIFGFILIKMSQLFAPIVPFFSEYSYQVLVSKDHSVHHSDWPESNERLIDLELEEQMIVARKAVEKIHSKRRELGLKVKQPLKKVSIFAPLPTPSKDLLDVIAQEVNVKTVLWKHATEDLKIDLDTNLDEDLIREGQIREIIRNIQKLRKERGLTLDQHCEIELESWPESFQKEIETKTNTTLKKSN